MITDTQRNEAVEASESILDGQTHVTPEPIKQCMQCQRFYFKRGVASIYVEPQRSPTTGICGPCEILYRQKYSIQRVFDGRKSLCLLLCASLFLLGCDSKNVPNTLGTPTEPTKAEIIHHDQPPPNFTIVCDRLGHFAPSHHGIIHDLEWNVKTNEAEAIEECWRLRLILEGPPATSPYDKTLWFYCD